MRRLRKKLNDSSGASILLALLLFLLCCMVSASILAAAASNAGKVRSSRVEQQKRLTLSSAIELVCGQLEKAEYKGCYEVYEWTEKRQRKDEVGNPVKDEDGNLIYDYYPRFYCVQMPGSYNCVPLDGLFSLKKEMDEVFGRRFFQPGYRAMSGTDIQSDPVIHRLQVSLPIDLNGYPYPENPDNPEVYEVSADVTLEVTLNHATQHITITAWLGGSDTPPPDGSNMMSAELVAMSAPVPEYNPAGRSAGDAPQGAGITKETAPVQWKLNWIKKGAI